MDWHEFSSARSPLIRSDNRFSLSHTDIQSPVSAHPPSWTHAPQTAFQHPHRKTPTCAHSAVGDLMTAQTWFHSLPSTTQIFAAAGKSLFRKRSSCSKTRRSTRLKITKGNTDYTESSTFLSTFQLFGTAVCHLKISCSTYCAVLQ